MGKTGEAKKPGVKNKKAGGEQKPLARIKVERQTLWKASVCAKYLNEVVKALSVLVDEFKVKIREVGVGIQVVDPAHVEMMSITIGREAFTNWWLAKKPDLGGAYTETVEAGLDVDKLKGVLELCGEGDELGLEYEEYPSKSDEAVALSRLKITNGTATYRIATLEIAGMYDPEIPQAAHSALVILPSVGELMKGAKACFRVSDQLTLCASSEKFEAYAEGSWSYGEEESDEGDKAKGEELATVEGDDDARLTLLKSQGTILRAEGTEPVQSVFPTDYFRNTVAVIPDGVPVCLSLGQNWPMKIEWKHGPVSMSVLLAPRIEKE